MNDYALISLTYVSKATQHMGMLSLMRLIGQAVSVNKAIGATGVLFYENEWFGQILEGPRSEIMALWEKIKLDPRHHQVRLIGIEEISQRHFPNWSMRFIGAEELSDKAPELRSVLNGLPDHDDSLIKAMRLSSQLS